MRPWFKSLTVRLAVLLALLAVITFGLVGHYLYVALGVELERRDDQDILAKIRVVRGLLAERKSIDHVTGDPNIFFNTASTPDRLLLVLKDSAGRTFFAHNADVELPPLPVVSVDDFPDSSAIRSFHVEGLPGRAVSAWASLMNEEKILITVARRGLLRTQFLHRYQSVIMEAAIAGALLISLAGYIVIRRGLSPLKRIAAKAETITAKELNSRLDTKDVPQEIELLVESFNLMLVRLNDSFQRLSQFSGDLAHDLRTPINNLLVQTQVAISQPRSVEEYQALLVSNIEEYERLKRMSESMLFLARADNGQIAVERKVLDSAAELGRVVEYFEGVTEDKGVHVEVRATGSLYANPMLFSRALSNLVSNAIRYTEPGGTIYIEALSSEASTVIKVRNPGRTIPSDQLLRIFDRFYRGDPARADSGSSAGLGLAIVRSIMTLHGGTASASNAEPGWSEFSLIFPAQG